MNSQKEVELFKRRCKRLISKIRKDFPLLKNTTINFKVKKLKSGSMMSTRIFCNYTLTADFEKYKDASDKELTGVLAHELSHFESYWKKNIWEMLKFGFLYIFSDKFVKKVERQTDIIAMKRGYREELLANRLFLRRTSSKEDKKRLKKYHYLSVKEIKKRLKKFRERNRNDSRN